MLFLNCQQSPPCTPLPFCAEESLGITSKRLTTLCFPQGDSRGKNAQTHFYPLHESAHFILGLAFPKTGRQHQIRTHAAHHGYPLLGDKLYHGGLELFGRFKDRAPTEADTRLMQIPRHALHALGIAFPYGGQKSYLIDQLPADLLDWISQHCPFPSLQEKIQLGVANYFKGFKKL